MFEAACLVSVLKHATPHVHSFLLTCVQAAAARLEQLQAIKKEQLQQYRQLRVGFRQSMSCMYPSLRHPHSSAVLQDQKLREQEEAALAAAAAEGKAPALTPEQQQRLQLRADKLTQRKAEAAAAKLKEQQARQRRLNSLSQEVSLLTATAS